MPLDKPTVDDKASNLPSSVPDFLRHNYFSNQHFSGLNESLQPFAPQQPVTSLLDRELAVVGKGLTEGLADAGKRSWSDLKDAASQFKNSPLNFTLNYAKDHGQEVATVAAIAFVIPQRLANVALLAYLSKGAITASDAVCKAADPQANIAKLHQSFRADVAHEGSSLLSSIPILLAGGMAGKASANAVFGKDHVAFDLIGGVNNKVTIGTVKANLWKMHDAIRPPAIKLVVSDMDNTMYSFSRYLAPGMRQGVKDLATKTGIEEAVLYKTIGAEMDAYSSFSYPWSIELALGNKLNVGKPGGMSYETFRTNLSDPFWKTIEHSLEQNGKPFPTVVSTLQALRDREIPVVVLTNASHSIGIKRMDAMGVTRGRLVDRMYVMENPPEPIGLAPELLAHGRQRIDAMAAIGHDFTTIKPIPRDWEKPSPKGMLEILDTYKLRPRQVLMVGDSVKNDIALAQATGTNGLLVRYKFTSPEDELVLRHLSNRPKMEKAKMGEALPHSANLAETTSFSGILDHLNQKADYQAILSSTAGALWLRPQISSALVAHGLTHTKQHLTWLKENAELESEEYSLGQALLVQ